MKYTEEILKRFGQRLRQKRQERGFTREKLVVQMDKLASESSQSQKAPDVSTVARWERGEQCPREFHLWLVCTVLQVTPEELGYPKPIRRWPGDPH
ncbi:MAG: helix-turn-helix transcriptional regulator [Thermogemmatispora sp.]|uniref:helix-turn-helix domain-containing protein n=1 Tax=Thermogemmatispora sp. TaxID=1968838 RepID=UPI0026025CFB|nr:helix-turn-helix transcriptional regulator [Thermogemmatispora sp.]MBX5457329.1 helix-turn-helix transcriptional regulator [Thermogemmatispora sp.]